MSVAASENSWGPAKNLGENINTALKEVSPFYDAKEGALFFSSDGHKGHGGLDIFMAEKIFDPSTELYNMGLPYNSSKNDVFFVLGEHMGFLASEREDGLGKMDIYSFLIESDEEIIAEILNFKEVAGRNSLFSSDYEFDNPDRGKIEEIISHHVASRLHGIQLSLTSDELEFYNNLSEADRARIDRIVNTRMKTINSTDIIAVRHEDEFFYQQLNSDFKYHVDKMVTLYMEDYELGPAVEINEDDKDFYESLNSNSKEKVDRYIALKLDEYEDLNFNDPFYESLNPTQKGIVDDISTSFLTEKSELSDLTLPQSNLDFLEGLSEEDRALAEISISNNVAALSSKPEFEIGSGEQIFYQNLTTDEKSSLDHIANAFITSSVDNIESHLDPQDLALYNDLSPAQQLTFDKVLAKRIQNFVKADKYTLDVMDDRDLERLTELQLTGISDVEAFLNDQEIEADSPLKTLAAEDQERFVRLLSNASNLVMMNTSSKIKDAALSVEREKQIEAIVASNKPGIPPSLNADEQPFYEGMTPEEEDVFDELLVQQLTGYVETNPAILNADYANNPAELERLQTRLANDMQVEKMVAGNGRLNATVNEMSPERKGLLSGALASAAAFMVTNSGKQLASLANQTANSAQFVAQMSNATNPALANASIPAANPAAAAAGQTVNAETGNVNTSSSSINLNSEATGQPNPGTGIAIAGAAAATGAAIGSSVDLTGSGSTTSNQPITAGDAAIAEMIESSRANYTDGLTGEQQQIFNDLTMEEKQFMDEAMANTISDYVNDNSRVLDLAESTDQQDIELVNAKLASDFSVNKLSSTSSLSSPTSLTQRPPSFRAGFSGLMAGLSKSVIAANADQLQQMAAAGNAGANMAQAGTVGSNNSGGTTNSNYTGNTNTSLNGAATNTGVTNGGLAATAGLTASTASAVGGSTRPTASSLASGPSAGNISGQSFDGMVSQSIATMDNTLRGTSLQSYQQLTPGQKALFDDILPQRLARAHKLDPEVFNAFQANDDQALQNGLSKIAAHATLNQPIYSDRADTQRAIEQLDPVEKDMMSKLLASSMSTMIAREGAALKGVMDRDGTPVFASANPNLASLSSSNSSLSANSRDVGTGSSTIPTAVNPNNRQAVSITEDDYNFYYNLDTDKRNLIDKVVALRIVNEFAIDGQHRQKTDRAYMKKLPEHEQKSVKRLAYFLNGENMGGVRANVVQSDLNYYDNLSNRKKDDVNRLIVGSVFNFTEEHNIYGVRGEDQKILSTFNPREKELFYLLHNIRSQTHNIFGNRLDLDQTILESQDIIAEVKSFDNQEFKNIAVEGSLFTIDGGSALGKFPLNLMDKNGNVVVSTMTTNDGSFAFKNVDAKGSYTIQSGDADINSRAKDRYFIKNLTANGNNLDILDNRYDEFFINDGQVSVSMQNSLQEISNLVATNPNNVIYIKVTDEQVGGAMDISLQLIEHLNRYGVQNTSIKFRRMLPSLEENPFEGYFKNKIELIIESDQRIEPNNYYSFLVRRNTNIMALSKELSVPEEVLAEENNLSSTAVAKNSIIRVWRPLSDPDMSLLVNVSNFQYQDYKVQNGESVITIADKLRLPEELIMEVNNLTGPALRSGQIIQIYVRR